MHEVRTAFVGAALIVHTGKMLEPAISPKGYLKGQRKKKKEMQPNFANKHQ